MAAVQTGDALHYGVLIVLLVYMVKSYGVAADPQDVGFYTGILMTMVSIGSLFTNLLWGVLSDRVGRKPCLFVSILSTAVTGLMLGFTRSFPAACVNFVVFGVFHGTPVLVKSTVAELCDRTNQSKGFALLVFCWGLGSIFGPVIGGVFAFPCAGKETNTILPHFFCTFPFLLPLAFTTVYHFGLSIAICFLRETVKSAPIDIKTVQYNGGNAHHANDMNGTNGMNGAKSERIIEKSNIGVDDVEAANAESHVRNGPISHSKIPTSHEHRSLILQSHPSNKPTNGTVVAVGRESSVVPFFREVGECEDVTSARSPVWNKNELTTRHVEDTVATSWGRQWDLAGVVVLFGLLLFSQFYAETLLCIYSAAPENVGGLGYDSKTMGVIGGLTGVCVLTFTILAIPKLARNLGPLNCIRVGFLISIPLWISAPMVGWLNGGLPRVKFGALLLLRMARSILGCMTFAGSMMVISNSAGAHNMGMVTGLGDTLGTFLTIIAPALSGWLWTLFSVRTFGGHEFVPWLILILLSGMLSGLAGMLPRRLNVSRI